jgi:HK97 family phage major capsid protein
VPRPRRTAANDPDPDSRLTPDELSGMNGVQLRAVLADLDAELTRIHYSEAGEVRQLSDEEQQRFDELIDLRAKAEQHARIRAAHERAGVVRAFGPTRQERPSGTTGQALRALEDLAQRNRIATTRADEVEREVRGSEPFAAEFAAHADPDYGRAFQLVVQHGEGGGYLRMTAPERDAMARALQAGETRAMAENVTTAGGFGVPVDLDPSILLTAQGSNNPFLELARQVNATSNIWKGVSSAGVTWSFDTEAAEVSDDSPVLAQPQVTVHMARGFLPFSIELSQDYPGFAEEMAMLLASGYDELLADKFARGSGTGEPQGLLTALSANANVRVRVTTSGTLGLVDIHRAWAALPEKFRNRAVWLSSASVQNTVRALGTAVGASFSVTLTQEGPERLMGAPYRTSAYLEDSTTGTGNMSWAIVGDPSNFIVARRSGLRLEPIQHLFGLTTNRPTGQRGTFAWARIGSASGNDLGFRILTNVT